MFYGFPSDAQGNIPIGNTFVAQGDTEEAVIFSVTSNTDLNIYPSVVILNSMTWDNKLHSL
jgi:hypothetical protein